MDVEYDKLLKKRQPNYAMALEKIEEERQNADSNFSKKKTLDGYMVEQIEDANTLQKLDYL